MRTQRSLDKRLRRFIYAINGRSVVVMTAPQKAVYKDGRCSASKAWNKYHSLILRCDHGGNVLSNELQLGSTGWGSCV
jgi:hypothetical protein